MSAGTGTTAGFACSERSGVLNADERPATPPIVINAAPAKTHRHFKQALVAIKVDHVAGPIQHRSAMLAVTEMLFHGRPQGRVDLLLNIVRNLAPYFLARYYHGFFPFTKLNRLFQLPPSPGASKSRNMRRARNKRVF